MPKSISKTKMSKKKKFNSRFPPARIKKIMQTDEDVGKVAATVPIIISRALEMFLESLIKETSQTTIAKNAKTLSTSHIKQTIYSNKQYNFLRALVANMPDHNTEDNTGKANGNSTCDTTQGNGDIPPKKKRGRPPKVRETPAFDKRKQGHSSKASPKTSDEDDDEEEDEDDETESEDEVQPPKPPAASSNHTTTSLPSPSTSSFSYAATENKSGTGITLVNTVVPQSYPPLLPPGYSVPAPASLVKQQQQLQVHQQMMMSQQQIPQQQQQQQQLVMGSAPPSVLQHPPYLPPTPLTTPNPSPLTNLIPQGSVDGYQLPPQLPHNPYYPQAVPMMPLAHQLPLHPGVSGYQQGMGHHMPAPQPLAFTPQTQAQPINLSLSSSQGQPLPRDQAENYDS